MRAVRLNPPLPPAVLDPAGLRQEVPAGFAPGPYDVVVSAPGGASGSTLRNGSLVCGGGTLFARLEPDGRASAVGPTPWPWRLLVEGDAGWFEPVPRHAARLLLPALDAEPEIRLAAGREAIEIHVPAGGGRPRVPLSGPDPDAMPALWRNVMDEQEIALAPADDRSYGPLRLAVMPGEGAGAPRRHRYEFESGRLVDARAWGPDARLGLAAVLLAAVTTAHAQDICAGTAPVPGAVLSSFPVVTGLGRPLLVTSPPGDVDRLFIVEQGGTIRLHRRGDPPAAAPTFLDITDRVLAPTFYNEMGLLGLAFDPDYATTGVFYVNYTEGTINGPWATVVSRFSRSAADPDLADPDSEERLLTFTQPQTNHNGGQLMFGPDGFLYVATGDGGGGGDPFGLCGNGQNRATLLGKFLRLDVRDLDPGSVPPDCGGPGAVYRIPSSNPFALSGTSDCGEIWALGLRNPWRSDFDPATGDLYIADVGQNCWEEVNVLPGGGSPGANLGWRSMEGLQCFRQGSTCDPEPVTCGSVPTCGDPSLTLPVVDYGHALGCSVTGGHVYRGCQMPGWLGTYFYGDFCAGFIASFRLVGGVATEKEDRTDLIDPSHTLVNGLTSFGEDAQGEIYVVDRDGIVRRIGPRFVDLEVSAPGDADPLMLHPGSWTWGDLAFATMRPVSHYRVYRGTPNGTFSCRFTSPTPEWAGGDPDNPPLGTLFAYVVTAVSPTGEETRPGIQAQGFLLGACP